MAIWYVGVANVLGNQHNRAGVLVHMGTKIVFYSSDPLFSCLGTKWGSTSATGTQAVVGKTEVRILGNGKGNPVPRPACF